MDATINDWAERLADRLRPAIETPDPVAAAAFLTPPLPLPPPGVADPVIELVDALLSAPTC